jgi:hypothetical protein
MISFKEKATPSWWNDEVMSTARIKKLIRMLSIPDNNESLKCKWDFAFQMYRWDYIKRQLGKRCYTL